MTRITSYSDKSNTQERLRGVNAQFKREGGGRRREESADLDEPKPIAQEKRAMDEEGRGATPGKRPRIAFQESPCQPSDTKLLRSDRPTPGLGTDPRDRGECSRRGSGAAQGEYRHAAAWADDADDGPTIEDIEEATSGLVDPTLLHSNARLILLRHRVKRLTDLLDTEREASGSSRRKLERAELLHSAAKSENRKIARSLGLCQEEKKELERQLKAARDQLCVHAKGQMAEQVAREKAEAERARLAKELQFERQGKAADAVKITRLEKDRQRAEVGWLNANAEIMGLRKQLSGAAKEKAVLAEELRKLKAELAKRGGN